ncbi:MAG TPA: amino acid adenylation domain-containing protein, partial [Thermoanaerobaculia bacterium]
MSEQFGKRPSRREEPPRNTPASDLSISAGQDPNAIPRRTDPDFAPLSFAQQRLWFLEQLEPGLSINNIPLILRLAGPLDVAALQSALGAIVRRHESLRTCIQVRDGQPIQWIAPEARVPLPKVDLSSRIETDREPEALRLAAIEIREPFDLTHAPMLRARLFQIAAEDHLLVVTMHHIAADGWSIGVFFRELGILYEAHSNSLPASLPDLPIQYADFAVWQRSSLQGELLEDQLSYWRERLQGAPALLDLPTDRPRPALQSYRGAVHRFVMPLSLLQQLKALSRREGATLFMTLISAFQVLLSRYSGQSDVLVGSPIAGRTELETEGLIGCFINTLVLRTDLSGDPTFQELLRQVADSAFGAYARQDLPFERLVEELRPARSLGHSPLFQVLFSLQNAPREECAFAKLRATIVRLERVQSRFDLSLEAVEKPDGLSCSLVFNTDLFDAETAAQMSEHFGNLLRGIVANPQSKVSSLPLLSETERHRLLFEWNETDVDAQVEMGVTELFEEQARRHPESPALEAGGSWMTFSELNGRANQLANHLRSRGIGSEHRVGLSVDRSPEMIVSLFAILKAGAAYVPLDPGYPAGRLAHMIRDAELSLIVTTRANELPVLPDDATPRLFIDTDWGQTAESSSENLPARVAPEALAYLIYTSGSTGKPKGVEVPNRALANLLQAMRRAPGLSRDDTFLAVTSLSFDIAALEIFLPLTVGARLVVASRGDAMDGVRLAERIRESGATAMQATPSLWRTLLDSGWKGEPQLKMLCGGEALSQELARALRRKGASLWNLYGPTETTVWSTVARIDGDDGPVVAGRPIDNTRIYVLDRQREPVPIGVVGEVWIGGAGLARGYRNLPDLTETQFLRDPFRREPGARMYRAGDLGRYRRDGSLVLLGRSDDQVKIRGFRIELGEIEAALLAHPAIRDAAAAAREDVSGDRTLVAYYVFAPAAALSAGDLRRFLKERLPEYMIPTALVNLDRLPRLPNGKVDRQSLPAADHREVASERGYVPPRTPVEEEVARIWAKVLRVERVGIEDNFFELGGHSLLATQVFSRLRRAFRVDLPIRTLFEMPTVAELCAAIERARETSAAGGSPPILPASRNPSNRPVLADELVPVEVSATKTVSAGQNPGTPVSEEGSARPPSGTEAEGAAAARLTSVERRRILNEWNQTRETFPSDPLPRVFEAQAKRTPDRVAVEFGGRKLTYRELDARANGLARRLRELGVGPEVLVGVCVTRSVEMLVALLGVLKAGGAYVPMDPAFPRARLEYILDDSAAAVVITERALADTLPAGSARPVFLDEATRESPAPPRVPINSDV